MNGRPRQDKGGITFYKGIEGKNDGNRSGKFRAAHGKRRPCKDKKDENVQWKSSRKLKHGDNPCDATVSNQPDRKIPPALFLCNAQQEIEDEEMNKTVFQYAPNGKEKA